MSYQPRILEKFESEDTLDSVTVPLAEYEWESTQDIRDPIVEAAGADYGIRLRGVVPGLKSVGVERVRFMVWEDAPLTVDTTWDNFVAKCQKIGRGWLFTIDSLGVRRKARAALRSMPTMTWEAGMILSKEVVVEFSRLSDWQSTTEALFQWDLGADQDVFTIRDTQGNAPITDMEWRFKAGANFRWTSGQVIRDRTRREALEGDGETWNVERIGFWPTRTNLINNGGFELNATTWTTGGTNTIARSTEQKKFGAASLKCTYSNNALLASFPLTLTAVAHSGSAWVWVPGNYDGTLPRLIFQNYVGATGTLFTNINLGLRDQWQRVLVPNVGIVGGDLVGTFDLVEAGTAPTVGRFIYIDGVQCEAGDYCTPYIETVNATRQRVEGIIKARAISTVMNPTQGWAAFRVKMGPPSTNGVTRRLIDWRTDDSNRLRLTVVGDVWTALRNSGGAGASATATLAYAAGDFVEVVMAWTSTQVKVSVNGAVFQTASNSSIPSLPADMDLGNSQVGTTPFYGDFDYVVFGTGTLTDADALTIANLLDTGTWPLDAWPGTAVREWTCSGVGCGIVGTVQPSASTNILVSSVNTVSGAFTTLGENRILLVGVCHDSPGITATSVFFAGRALSLLTVQAGAGDVRLEVWWMLNPPQVAGVVTVNFSGTCIAGVVLPVCIENAQGVTPGISIATGTSTTPSVVRASAVNQRVVDFMVTQSTATATAGGGQTELQDVQHSNGGRTVHTGSSHEVGAASVTMDWTLADSRVWCIAAFDLDVQDTDYASPSLTVVYPQAASPGFYLKSFTLAGALAQGMTIIWRVKTANMTAEQSLDSGVNYSSFPNILQRGANQAGLPTLPAQPSLGVIFGCITGEANVLLELAYRRPYHT